MILSKDNGEFNAFLEIHLSLQTDFLPSIYLEVISFLEVSRQS